MSDIIACIYEGSAEKAILDRLLEGNKLVFSYSDLLDNTLIQRTNTHSFCQTYLNRSFGSLKVKIIRVIDNKNEGFPIKHIYKRQISSIETYCTCPEIEILIIIAYGHYDKYIKKYKSKIRPSAYCKTILKISDVKTYDFVYNFFSDINHLIDVLREYKRIHKFENNEKCLLDLIK